MPGVTNEKVKAVLGRSEACDLSSVYVCFYPFLQQKMDDDELKAIRAKRMAELQAQSGGSPVSYKHFLLATTFVVIGRRAVVVLVLAHHLLLLLLLAQLLLAKTMQKRNSTSFTEKRQSSTHTAMLN